MRAESVLKLLELEEFCRDKNCLRGNGTEGAVSVFYLSNSMWHSVQGSLHWDKMLVIQTSEITQFP